MNKKLGILIVLLLSLVSTSVFLTNKNTSTEINTPINGVEEIKGEETQVCSILEESAKEQLLNLPSLREWYVKSPYVENNYINIQLELPKESVSVKYSLNDSQNEALFEDGKWKINIPIDNLESGEYKLLVDCTICENKLSKSFSFKVSNPVYVTWTIDWEGFDVKEQYLQEMVKISEQYDIPMTHFFNPYIYIYLSSNRATYLTNWVKNRTEDSIGLHLHMYDSLVKASGVKVNNNPAWGSPMGNGHDTPNSNYSYEDFKEIILWSINQFEKNGIERPTMYRAGGWFIDEENINVLNDLDFQIESSGRTYYIHGRNLLEGPWNLSTTTQPYQMNSRNQNTSNNPNINIWEYPNNGGDSWAYTSEQLVSNFKSNYDRGIQNVDTVVTFLSHPHWFDKEGPKIQEVLKYVYTYSYNNDKGPVIFLTLDKVHEYNVKL